MKKLKIFDFLFESKRSKELKEDIKLGLRCKSCENKIMNKSKWGKETLCDECETAMSFLKGDR